jgi:hypothetical protein
MNCDKFPKGKGFVDNRPKCTECGLPNKCGVALGKGTCWCFQYPNIEMDKDSDVCLCESCLKKKVKELP